MSTDLEFFSVIARDAVRHIAPEERWWFIVRLPARIPPELMPRPPEDGCASLLPECRVVQRRRAHKRT